MNTTLMQCEQFFCEEGVECLRLKATPSFPKDRLVIFLGEDYRQRDRLLEITADKQKFSDFPTRNLQSSHPYIRISFEFMFPFNCSTVATVEMARLLHFVNQFIELPGFELNEVNQKIVFRYILISSTDHINKDVCTTIAGLIMMVLDLFTKIIEEIASDKITFNEIWDDLGKLLEQIK